MKHLKDLTAIFNYINKHPLAGRHKLIAYTRFINWQLIQFIHPSERVVHFVAQTYLSVNKGMTGATGNIYLGLHDFFEMGFLLHFLRKEDLFADIGANIGSYSILASGVNGAKTIAFEPSIKTFTQLQKNISINNLENLVKAYNLALGSKLDTLFFTTSLDTINHVIPINEVGKDKDSVKVEVNTLDNILKDQGIPSLIKVDVEGFETEVINGMNKVLLDKNLKAIIIELNGSGLRYGYTESQIHEKLILYDFQPYLYDAFNRTFILCSDYGTHNTLYLRDMSFIKNRVTNAKKIKIFNEIF